MTISISASGSRQDVLSQLESQRDTGEHAHSSLKNQLLDHLAGFVESAPADAGTFTVSLSGFAHYSIAEEPPESKPDAS